jgi:arginase
LAVVRRAAPAYWLHVDLDVLASSEFAAADYQQRGGLRWDDVRRVIVAALADRRCAGASVVIYNPDLDPGRTIAAEVVAQLAAAVGAARNGDS